MSICAEIILSSIMRLWGVEQQIWVPNTLDAADLQFLMKTIELYFRNNISV